MILKRNFKQIVGILVIFIMLLICLYTPIYSIANADYVESSLITVAYLERLENTPFAHRVYRKVRVPVKDYKININDVANKLGNQVYGVLNSYCERFRYISSGDYYLAEYENAVYLNAKTSDGKFKNYFLDINNSFYDYYAQFVKASDRKDLRETYTNSNSERSIKRAHIGVQFQDYGSFGFENVWKNENDSNIEFITPAEFSWFWNQIHKKFPETNGVFSTELYGYWGFVPIPRSYSFNDLISKGIFNIDTTFKGVYEHINLSRNLSFEAYNSLLRDYDYSWLEVCWADFIKAISGGTADANFYLFYANGESNTAFIAENGATNLNDNRSGTVIKGEEIAKDVGSKLKDLFSGDKLKKTLIIVIGVVVGVILLLIILKVLSLISSKKGRGSQ